MEELNIKNYKDFYNEKGYVLIKDFLRKKTIQKLSDHSKLIIKKAVQKKWKFIKIYRDYPHLLGGPNIFGIDYPLNEEIDKNSYNYFQDLNIIDLVKSISGFKFIETELIRLHTNSNFFKYQGEWHRDHSTYPSPNCIQTIIYLNDEKGFRIVPKIKNQLLSTFGIDTEKDSNKIGSRFIDLPKNLYDVINANAGDVLFFEPGLLHQGFCKKYRLHYILRHKKKDKDPINIIDKFNFSDDYLPNANLENKSPTYYSNKSFVGEIFRIKTLLFYFIPRVKTIFKNLFLKNKLSIFHSTFWQ